MNILIIDDERFMLNLLARQLAKLGFTQVTLHERAQDALTLLEGNIASINLVFCDLQMPEIDGIECVRQLAGLGYSGGLVLVSGEDRRILQSAENLCKAHRLNILGVLAKPIAPEQLRQIMDNKSCRAAAAAPKGPRKSYEADDIRQAIMNGELVNYYQPKVSMDTGAVVGVESLVRWRHPAHGMVFPDQFIDTAEASGLIDDLTRAVIMMALHQSRLWRDSGLHLHMGVNVSMHSFDSPAFLEFVTSAMLEAGVAHPTLVLEVTETQLIRNPLASLEAFTRLRLKRIGLSIDDFGTGHSSLAQLRDIPFDELKIDQGFVHGAMRNHSLGTLVEASQNIARQLGINTVAEGVEDQEDWDFVRAAGCNVAQGYFIAKPMPADDLPGWYDTWLTRRGAMTTARV